MIMKTRPFSDTILASDNLKVDENKRKNAGNSSKRTVLLNVKIYK